MVTTMKVEGSEPGSSVSGESGEHPIATGHADAVRRSA
jgi:hypothetical protein